MAMRSGVAELGGEFGVHRVKPAGDAGGRRERLAAGFLGCGAEAEQRQGTVADELVEVAAGGLDRLAHHGEIAVEQEHRVEGQPVFGAAREAAQVAEQHREFAFVARRGEGAVPGDRRPAPAVA